MDLRNSALGQLDALKKQVADQQTLIESLQKGVASSTSTPLPGGKTQAVETPMAGIEPVPKSGPQSPNW